MEVLIRIVAIGKVDKRFSVHLYILLPDTGGAATVNSPNISNALSDLVSMEMLGPLHQLIAIVTNMARVPQRAVT